MQQGCLPSDVVPASFLEALARGKDDPAVDEKFDAGKDEESLEREQAKLQATEGEELAHAKQYEGSSILSHTSPETDTESSLLQTKPLPGLDKVEAQLDEKLKELKAKW